jgi:GntR family transcriptional regulator/MocR family aminotransferase
MDCINSSELSKKCRISEKDSGLHFILEFDTDFSDSELCSRFEEKGIHISPVSDFYVNKDSAPEHKFILNYSNIDVFSLAKALVIMSQCITH